MEEGCAGHFEGIFEGGITFWFGLADLLDRGDMVVWITGHVTDTDCDAVTHSYHAELGDGVLFEVFVYELDRVGEHEEVAGGSEVFLVHR